MKKRYKNFIVLLSLLMLLILSLQGQLIARNRSSNQGKKKKSSIEKVYNIHRQDILNINIYMEDDLQKHYRVSQRGYISYPFIGDDFIIMTTPERVGGLCSIIIDNFERNIPAFYGEEDREKSYIETIDRRGNPHRFPFMTLSIGVTTNESRAFNSPLEVSAIATEMKQYAKTFMGSNYKKDRRVG